MDRVILDAATQSKLTGLTKLTPLYDSAGEVIAYAVPPDSLGRYLGIPPEPPFTDEELKTAFDQPGPGRLLEDILRDLREGR